MIPHVSQVILIIRAALFDLLPALMQGTDYLMYSVPAAAHRLSEEHRN
ncbi:MAG TPA: hypothetical protein VFM77_20620 [Terriglobales bacterium]|nr:hypothetical protein [Terriglobales bacterium]